MSAEEFRERLFSLVAEFNEDRHSDAAISVRPMRHPTRFEIVLPPS